jgi:hypothetical protein
VRVVVRWVVVVLVRELVVVVDGSDSVVDVVAVVVPSVSVTAVELEIVLLLDVEWVAPPPQPAMASAAAMPGTSAARRRIRPA